MNRVLFFSVITVILFISTSLGDDQTYEADWESLDRRPVPPWFNEAKFGIFVVWGPYSVPAYVDRGYSEWYRWQMENKNSATWKFHEKNYGKDFAYEEFAPLFKAEMWDPDFWADLFVKSGARYVVTTANYHDGFCLYPSKYDATTHTDQWNSVETGPKRDLLGELNEAGRKRGLKMGIYYSLYEWFHPLWISDRDRYVTDKFHPQFKEVVTRYRPPIIFLDGEWEMDYKRWRSEELAAWLFNESPVRDIVVINDRWGKCRGKHGTYYSSEYGGGNFPPTHPWEENRGIGASYGYNRNETIYDYDSREALIRMLSKICGNGGNFLLDVGPTADGRIPVIMQERLLQIGEWLEVNGEAVYGSGASPFWPRRFSWGTCTFKAGRIYLHLHGYPSKKLELPGLRNEIRAAYLLAGKSPVPFERTTHGVRIDLPAHLPDPAVSIVVLHIEGEPDIDRTIHQEADGSALLHARDAEIHGSSPIYETGGKKDQIGYWGDAGDSVSWEITIDRAGTFDVEVTYSCSAGCGGSGFSVESAGYTLKSVTRETGTWDTYRTDGIGQLKFAGAGVFRLELKPDPNGRWKSMGLQSIRLTPGR